MGNGGYLAGVVVIDQIEVEPINDLAIHFGFKLSLDFLAMPLVHVYNE